MWGAPSVEMEPGYPHGLLMPMGRAGPLDAGGGTRCFFHPVKGGAMLTDDVGVDAADIGTAFAQILTALHDLRAADPGSEDNWLGWCLEIVDHTGHLLGRISLDEPGAEMEAPQRQRQYA
jgi:hypothetical protein